MINESARKILTSEQMESITRFAANNGEKWKSKLNEIWMNGGYGNIEDSCYLQQIRNQYGPQFLSEFRLPT